MKQFIQIKPNQIKSNQTIMHAHEALDMQLHLTVYLQRQVWIMLLGGCDDVRGRVFGYGLFHWVHHCVLSIRVWGGGCWGPSGGPFALVWGELHSLGATPVDWHLYTKYTQDKNVFHQTKNWLGILNLLSFCISDNIKRPMDSLVSK